MNVAGSQEARSCTAKCSKGVANRQGTRVCIVEGLQEREGTALVIGVEVHQALWSHHKLARTDCEGDILCSTVLLGYPPVHGAIENAVDLGSPLVNVRGEYAARLEGAQELSASRVR